MQEGGGNIWNVYGSSTVNDMRNSIKPEVRKVADNIEKRNTFYHYTGWD